jgi:Na+/melibiose symporter-like transporter
VAEADLTTAVPVDQQAAPARDAAPLGRLSRLTMLTYGLGETAEGVKSAALETFLFFYYVQVTGLSGTLTGFALLIALMFDGLLDPLIGNLSDNFHGRLGRRHPFLYAAPIPLAVAVFALFAPPAGLGQWALFGWLLGFTIFSRVMQSLYFVPHMALGAELTTDFKERVEVSGYRALFSYVGRLLALGVAFSIFFRQTAAFPNGQLNPAAYPPFAITCGLIAGAAIFISALGTQKRAIAVYDRIGDNHRRHGAGSFLTNLLAAFRLKSFAVYFTAILISYILGGVQAALAIHLNTYYWRLPPSGIQIVFFAGIFGFIVGTPFAQALAARFDKKAAYVGGVVFSVLVAALPIVLSLFGLYPTADKGLLALYLAVNGFIAGFIGSPAVVISGAMLADIADEYELRFRGRSEGFLFGASAFTRKASLGVGGAIAGIALDIIRFPRGVPVSAVPREATIKLAILYGPAMLVFTVISMSIMWMYDLTRQRHAEILRLLERG